MRLNNQLKLRKLGSQYFIVSDNQGNVSFCDVFKLNETSAFLWNHFQQKDFIEDDMVRALQEEYEVEYQKAFSDVKKMIEQWLSWGLIFCDVKYSDE